MASSNGTGESATVYAVRLAESASDEVEQEHERLQALSGTEVADAWQDGLLSAVRTLATLPERCLVAPEDVLFSGGTVRQLLYQRRRGSPTWRILFTVHEADEDDSATVQVHHVRHGARPPMSEWPTDEEN